MYKISMTDNYKKICQDYSNVSRETFEKLEKYVELVLKWQKSVNLISNSTISQIWERHVCDSVQLINLMDINNNKFFDIGSGAGFPGLVLAIILQEKNPEAVVELVESDRKKCLFLNEVKRQLGLNVKISNQRIENLDDNKYDVITSRALASLDKLFDYVYRFCDLDTKLIFPKGENFEKEILDAKENWVFSCKIEVSKTNDKAVVLIIENLHKN
jgi:16S rRNA (guanine527-N7)-methyltransferase